ncbi:hypothetical protein N7517_003193 [Penicillium concentricum]|uniref:CFEM domain-containing protein n=1 Tax=Penicillium concentricum TaxID=293559 RepID=A0A9W9SVS3_9EURO|nr:uncharacterized protein N7517_003193 [Penicillium concentricum]KAJ5385282.1 hypothetical protein N7517_003193 [Penicillium concentricum]
MKFTVTFALAALLSTAAAQGLGDLPDCSKSCATGSIPENCGIDFKCICESKSFLGDVACCVADKCSKADQDTTIKVAKSICARGGVTDIPTEVVCSSSKSSSNSSTSTSASTSSNSTETGTKSSTEASAATKTEDSTSLTGTNTSTKTSNGASTASSVSAAATSTGVAALTHKDSSLVAAAGAAAAFAILI